MRLSAVLGSGPLTSSSCKEGQAPVIVKRCLFLNFLLRGACPLVLTVSGLLFDLQGGWVIVLVIFIGFDDDVRQVLALFANFVFIQYAFNQTWLLVL